MNHRRKYRIPVGVLLLVVLLLTVTMATYADTASAVAGGEYTPTAFSFSGGTGKLTISCERVVVEDGNTSAELIFSSPNISYVKVGGTQYDTSLEDGQSVTPLIPVVLDEDNEIVALTTAMSQPHEITYTIYVSLTETADAGTLAESGGEANAAEENAGASASKNTSAEELGFSDKTDLLFAEGVDIYVREDGYRLIDIHEGDTYLIVPEDEAEPTDLPDEIQVIRRPLSHIYIANSSGMALFDAIGALSQVTMSSLDADAWYIDAPREALSSGAMIYAGKYSEPDYELLLSQGCDLAVENTMIYHSPETAEMLRDLGIPVFIDRSSYEENPLGRMEWAKVYAAILDCEEAAESWFSDQLAIVEEMEVTESLGKTAAFFSMNSNGTVVVRRANDYIVNMLRLAGGDYAFDDLTDGDGGGTTNLSFEEFYSRARDIDFLIYNSTIEEPLSGVADLIAKSPLFEEFRAVQEGNVWQAEKKMYQSTDSVATIIGDFHRMLTDGDESEMTFLTHLS